MGQKQTKVQSKKVQSYPEQKPSQIQHLQQYIETNAYKIVTTNDPPQLTSAYEFILSSAQSQHYKYGVKLSNPDSFKNQRPTLNKLSDFVQIYLLPEKLQTQKHILVFEGEFVKGKRSNFGVEYNEKGQIVYQGFFKNNKYQGWGFTPIYQGQWVQGTKCGYGLYDSTNQNDTTNQKPASKSLKYEGMWKNDSFNGLGAKNVAISQAQQFLKPKYQQAPGKAIEQYIGEWLDGARCGCGKSIKYLTGQNSSQRQIYEGEFANNLYQGHGKLMKQAPQFVQGTFSGGKLVKTL